MKKGFTIPIIALSLFSCTQQTKTSTEKFTDTAVHDSVSKAGDTTKKNISGATMPAAANDTIVPGKSIGHILLNERMDDVIRALGQPDSTDAAMGKSMSKWFSKPSKKGADTAIHSIIVFATTNFGGKDEASRVKHIRITSPFFKTAEGVGCGSTIAFIKMQYPTIKKAGASYTDRSGNTVLIYDDTNEGIAYEIDASTRCVGITVHARGQRAREVYNAEFGDVEEQ